MKKSDFFNEDIISFAGSKHHGTHHGIHGLSLIQNVIYYEWNKSLAQWIKLREEDPDPDQEQLPNGAYDGQIIEVEL